VTRRRYHEPESCQCGNEAWGRGGWADDPPVCRDCDTGPYEPGSRHEKIHVARKSHGTYLRAGDKYRRIVQFGHFPGGAFTLYVRKVLIDKGPLWGLAEVMES